MIESRPSRQRGSRKTALGNPVVLTGPERLGEEDTWDVLRYTGHRCYPSGRIEGDHHLAEDDTPWRKHDTRPEAFVVGGGTFAVGSVPEIDERFHKQAGERDHGKREALLHEIQRLVHEQALFAPIWE